MIRFESTTEINEEKEIHRHLCRNSIHSLPHRHYGTGYAWLHPCQISSAYYGNFCRPIRCISILRTKAATRSRTFDFSDTFCSSCNIDSRGCTDLFHGDFCRPVEYASSVDIHYFEFYDWPFLQPLCIEKAQKPYTSRRRHG